MTLKKYYCRHKTIIVKISVNRGINTGYKHIFHPKGEARRISYEKTDSNYYDWSHGDISFGWMRGNNY